jgi:hypothetical protein
MESATAKVAITNVTRYLQRAAQSWLLCPKSWRDFKDLSVKVIELRVQDPSILPYSFGE